MHRSHVLATALDAYPLRRRPLCAAIFLLTARSVLSHAGGFAYGDS